MLLRLISVRVGCVQAVFKLGGGFLSNSFRGILTTMSAKYHSGRKTALLYFLGILFCVLSITFAVTSKVAEYYPHNDATRPITASKMWQQEDVTVRAMPPVQAAPEFLLFVFIVAATIQASRSFAWMQTSAEFMPDPRLCYRRAHAIRPPPARQ